MGINKWNIGWGPISACNMNCQFCYSKNVRKKIDEDLKLEDWIKFVDENHEFINSINYGTGENSISDDWFQLIEYIHTTYKIPQALTSNGYIIERIKKNKKFEKIFLSAISEVDISLDFYDKKDIMS